MSSLKDLLRKFKDLLYNISLSKQTKIVIAGVMVLCAAVGSVAVFAKPKEKTVVYEYDEIEQQIADEVVDYLLQFLELQEDVAAQIADEAVQSYNIILSSDAELISDEHTAAIKQRIRSAMIALIDDAGNLTDEELESLSSGIAEIVLNAILSQVEEVTVTEDFEKEYYYLTESIQGQIDKLEERKMKLSIQANIKNNVDDELNPEELLSTVENMSDEELRTLAESLGISLEELQKLKSVDNDKLLEEKILQMKEEITSELQESVQDGKDGKDGTVGKDGKDGKDGKKGEDGIDGKTTYIAYADDTSGTGFSLTPTETSKYVGTCITAETKQPVSVTDYSNWQPYRAYVITTTTDENGVTTVHIN